MTRLLLVEDDTAITLALQIRLRAAGYDVATAPDAVHAMAQAVRHAPEVILLDINLPGGDGFLVLDRLRATPATATVPIVFVTASKAPDLHDRARAAGAFALIEKPFSATQLLDTLERAIGGEGNGMFVVAA